MALLPLFRQSMVGLSPQLAAFSIGGAVTFPTLLLHQLKANDSRIHLDMDTASWIGSIYGLAGIPAVIIPMIMQWKGRKLSFMLTCSFVIIGWILSYVATSVEGILAGESFNGLGTNTLMYVGFLSMSEMIEPRYRLLSMQLYGVIQCIGMAVCGIGGRFFHYKTMSIIMLIPAVVAMLLALIWPESPPWLASKGKFKKCEQAFLWLRGSDEESVKELSELIAAQKENFNIQLYNETYSLRKIWNQLFCRNFYIPCFHVFILMNMLYGSGGDVVLIYFLELVEKSTQSEEATFYSAIIVYSLYVSGALVTQILGKYFRNKTILFFSMFGVICSLLCITVVTFLQSKGVLAKESFLLMYLLTAFMVFNVLGLTGFTFYVCAELIPVKHRNIGGAFLIICNCSLYALTLKIYPYLIQYIDMWGTFLIFTVNGIVCLYLVCKYVPETKYRTLQEIEDFYTYGRFIVRKIEDSTDSAI